MLLASIERISAMMNLSSGGGNKMDASHERAPQNFFSSFLLHHLHHRHYLRPKHYRSSSLHSTFELPEQRHFIIRSDTSTSIMAFTMERLSAADIFLKKTDILADILSSSSTTAPVNSFTNAIAKLHN